MPVLMYGPPGVGKDTVTRALSDIEPTCRLFERVKCGPGRADGYRLVQPDELEQLRQAGDVLYENRRYQSVYVVDRSGLQEQARHGVPVVHIGQPEGVIAVTAETSVGPWLVVELRCRRDTAESRIEKRGSRDTAARLQAFDTTPELTRADLVIDTDQLAPEESATLIQECLRRGLHAAGNQE